MTKIDWILCSKKMPKMHPQTNYWMQSDEIFATDGKTVTTGIFQCLVNSEPTIKDFCSNGPWDGRIKAWAAIPKVKL